MTTYRLTVENVAGILHADAELTDGVNAVRASNWQGKSSFLAAIEAVFGVGAPLTQGADDGRVELDTGDDRYAVELARSGGEVTRSGRPYLTDDVDLACAELFAFLDETNDLRRAVRLGEDLESVLTRPIDLERIEARIAEVRAERDRVATARERVEERAARRPALAERVRELESRLEERREDAAAVERERPVDHARDELAELQAERDRVEREVRRLEATEAHVGESLADRRGELEDLDVPTANDVAAELERRESDLRDLERDADLLQSVYEANKRVLDEDRLSLLTDVSHGLETDALTCWVCGGETTREEVADALAAVDDRLGRLRERVADARSAVDRLEDRNREVERAKRRRSELTDLVGDLESRFAEVQADLEAARERLTELEAAIEERTEAAEASLDETAEVRSERKYVEAELSDARGDLDAAERAAERVDELDAEYDDLSAELTRLRTRTERVERETREAFSEALADLLERFDVGFETARLTDGFELVVARGGREAPLDALSEGERELLGIVAALAGHEAFDVAERLPVMLLDGHTGLEDANLHRLVDYLADRVEVLVLSAYPGYERFDGTELSPADWETVAFDAASPTNGE